MASAGPDEGVGVLQVLRYEIGHADDPAKGQPREAWLEEFFRHPLLPKLLADAGYLTMHTGKYWMGEPAAAGFTRDMGKTDRHGGQALAIGRETMQPIDDAIDAGSIVVDDRLFY